MQLVVGVDLAEGVAHRGGGVGSVRGVVLVVGAGSAVDAVVDLARGAEEGVVDSVVDGAVRQVEGADSVGGVAVVAATDRRPSSSLRHRLLLQFPASCSPSSCSSLCICVRVQLAHSFPPRLGLISSSHRLVQPHTPHQDQKDVYRCTSNDYALGRQCSASCSGFAAQCGTGAYLSRLNVSTKIVSALTLAPASSAAERT